MEARQWGEAVGNAPPAAPVRVVHGLSPRHLLYDNIAGRFEVAELMGAGQISPNTRRPMANRKAAIKPTDHRVVPSSARTLATAASRSVFVASGSIAARSSAFVEAR